MSVNSRIFGVGTLEDGHIVGPIVWLVFPSVLGPKLKCFVLIMTKF